MEAGADGFLIKDGPVEDLAADIAGREAVQTARSNGWL
jgi:hypothetical protein